MHTYIHTVYFVCTVCTYTYRNTLHTTVHTVRMYIHIQKYTAHYSAYCMYVHTHTEIHCTLQCILYVCTYTYRNTLHSTVNTVPTSGVWWHSHEYVRYLTCAFISVYHRPSNPGPFSALFLSALALFFASLSAFSSSCRCNQEPLNGMSMSNIVCYNFSHALCKN